MQVGATAEVTRRFSADDIAAYVQLGGAPSTTVPEPLIGGLFSFLLGVKLPGLGTMYMKQETIFLHPVDLNETLRARVEITRLRPEKHLVDLKTTCDTVDGRRVAEGRALVYVRDVQQ